MPVSTCSESSDLATVTAETGVPVAGSSWRREARCAGQYLDYFFPPLEREQQRDRQAREAVARAVCHSCPVVQPCLDLAQELGKPPGIWGGLNERERSRLRARPR